LTQGEDVINLRRLFTGDTGADPVVDRRQMLAAIPHGGTNIYTDIYVDADGAGAGIAALVVAVDHVAPTVLQLRTDIVWA
jgi:hypothetical protein